MGCFLFFRVGGTKMAQKGNPLQKNRAPGRGTLVMKFGGTSVGTPEAMRQTVEIIHQARTDWSRLVVVTSALSGVTNQLLDGAHQATNGNRHHYFNVEHELLEKHAAIANVLLHDPARRSQALQEVEHLVHDFSSLCQAIGVLGEATPRALDAVAGLGERMSARLLAAALEAGGVPAQLVESTQVIITDDDYQSAHPDFEETARRSRQILEPLLVQGKVPVVTGFIGATSKGIPTTLGRGGSDYSAAILGALMPADEVWIWTDVDGVMSADPRLVPEACTIAELSYREIAELAYFGAKVVHPKTIRPVVEAGVGLRICNTFNPAHPGTRLAPEENGYARRGAIIAVTAIRGQKLVTIEGRGMLGVPGVAARAFAAVASTGTSVPLITQSSSEQSICFALPSEAASMVQTVLEKTFTEEINHRDIDRVWTTGEVVIITVVGAGLIHTPGVAGKVFGALGWENVNVIAIAQGSSEVSISLVVRAEDAEPAVRALHNLILSEISVKEELSHG
jgi:bifunctional aspartokinase / homoserine dehydrogenase 1